MTSPVRLPDVASVEAVLANLSPASADTELAGALSSSFPGFAFQVVRLGDQYWRDTRSVLLPDGSRIGDLKAWMTRELAQDGDDVRKAWNRLRLSNLRISEWHGENAYAFASSGSGVADFVQVSLGRELEWRAGPVVDPQWPPYSAEELLDPSWIRHGEFAATDIIAGPIYALRRPASAAVIHMRSFLSRCERLDLGRRDRRRAELEHQVVRETGPSGLRETPYLEAFPDAPSPMPREIRFFRDWEQSSAAGLRVFDYWAFDIQDYEHRGEREVGFITRPLKHPAERLVADDSLSVHPLMDRIERIDAEVGAPFAWFFLMTHGNWIEPEIGHAIAAGLRADRIRLPAQDAGILMRWAQAPYGF